jgi:cytochrome P450
MPTCSAQCPQRWSLDPFYFFESSPLLTINTAHQTKLAEEIRSTFYSFDDIVGGPTLFGCKYLKAFIQESLRVAPPVGAELNREVMKGGMVVDGEFVPEGANVSVGHYCLSHNRDIFPDPFEFRPERWIVGDKASSAESVALAESAFCAFSAGPRGCPGKNLAWLEMMIIVAKIIYKFEVRRDFADNLGGGSPGGRPGRRDPDQFQTYDAFVGLRQGPMVQFKRR